MSATYSTQSQDQLYLFKYLNTLGMCHFYSWLPLFQALCSASLFCVCYSYHSFWCLFWAVASMATLQTSLPTVRNHFVFLLLVINCDSVYQVASQRDLGYFYPPPFQRSKEFVPHKIVTCWKRKIKIKGWQAKETLIFFLNGGLEEYIFPQVCDNSFKIHVWETDFHNKDQCTLSTFFCIINPVLLSRIECNLIH